MQFVLDENVPVSVSRVLVEHGHSSVFIRDHIPPGSPDELVATISERLDLILVSFDGDFEGSRRESREAPGDVFEGFVESGFDALSLRLSGASS